MVISSMVLFVCVCIDVCELNGNDSVMDIVNLKNLI